ncbi:hypothetical protein V5799_015745 [Amblyomma americanum]|uniref:Uncharacterized protein n=1 Tax=Amblyomma americanum TaxID=6943 RepID=A0AAQ4F7R7_AMBAM
MLIDNFLDPSCSKQTTKELMKRAEMQRYLVYAVIILFCVQILMSSVNGCNTSLRPASERGKGCLGRVTGQDCHKDGCRYPSGGCNGCIGSHAWCKGCLVFAWDNQSASGRDGSFFSVSYTVRG